MEAVMHSRFLLSVLVVLAVAGIAGCSDRHMPLDPSGSQSFGASGVTAAKPDSVPKPPPHPEIPIVQFAGADAVPPGHTSITRWIMGNDRSSAQTITWQLTDDAGWPSLPQSGSIDVPKRSTRLLEVAVTAPDSVALGSYVIHMMATLRRTSTTADGAIPVVPDSTTDS